MRICLALAAMLFVVPVASAAQQKASDVLKPPKKNISSSPITDRFALRITYFAPSVDTLFRLDPDGGLLKGTLLSAENNLGLDDKVSQARMEMIFRINENNRMRVDYFKLARSGDQIVTGPIIFGNNVFLANDRVQTALEWRSLGFTYSRSVYRSERFEAGVGLGVSFVEARARGAVVARNIREERSAVAGFPMFALDGTWRISKRWALTGRGQRISANINDFSGLVADYHGDIQYRLKGNFAVGLGYTRLRTNVDVVSSSFSGLYHQDVAGPEVFIRASF
ncbi:MAG: hypothetical protein ABI885_12905 [Gammaproteobacteria bacterium]